MYRPQFQFIETNNVRLRVALDGEGPLILMLHGWPESWYSWRRQMQALAAAGYRVAAPDMRGYGQSSAPESIEEYTIFRLTEDVFNIMDSLGGDEIVLMGHDWGVIVSWHCALFHPERIAGHVAMSVPYMGRPGASPIDLWKAQYGDDFFYILYFQEPGVAEAEFDADPHTVLSRLYVSPDTPREAPEVTDKKASAGGWTPRLGKPKELPPWLSQEDLDYYIGEFTRAGFRGGINYYRNFTYNWERTENLDGVKVAPPTLFIAGEKDPVIRRASEEKLRELMAPAVEDLRKVTLFPGIGHWVQQEKPDETTAEILAFLQEIGY